MTSSSNNASANPFHARDTFDTGNGQASIYRLSALEDNKLGNMATLPYSIRNLLESVLRNCDGNIVLEEDVKNLAAYDATNVASAEVPFKPARVVLQDFTGVPAVVDLAAMRSGMQRLGGDPRKINPLIPVDLVIDHSVQVDQFGSDAALQFNVQREFQRNQERYEFLRWGQKAFDNFRAVPPNVGIVHQVNLEFLAKGVFLRDDPNDPNLPVAVPDTLVGTDSHTTMINGLGVVGWGVGGIEAEAVMLGQPYYMLMPEVIGFELTGKLAPGATATDLVLTVVEILRKEGVVGKFVEFHGSGVANMTLADRATIANMAPEYGATMGYFPIDEVSLNYLHRTGRTKAEVQLVERYTKEQGTFRTPTAPVPTYTRNVTLDVGTVEPSLAGPKRPQDRIALSAMKADFAKSLTAPVKQRGFALTTEQLQSQAIVAAAPKSTGSASDEHSAATSQNHNTNGSHSITHGAVVIAAITSCTNTSNPSVMVAAGLVAQKAAALGLTVPPHVKTSLAPGSRVVTDYLDKAGLTEALNQLGFHTVGYGCTTCIGNSGPLPEPVAEAVRKGNLVASAVLSGNRNFEGRVNPLVQANYLASPPLVVAYALAGSTSVDITSEPLGKDANGNDVFLKDVWPTHDEVNQIVESCVTPDMFTKQYGAAFTSNEKWNAISTSQGDLFDWKESSTYIQEPPFVAEIKPGVDPIQPIHAARVLCLLGDSVTTDHISPAGAIAQDGPAGRYLTDNGVEPMDFNSFGSRRGNDRVMHRGTFANIRIRNQMAPGTEGGWTTHLPSNEQMSIFDAAERYKAESVPLVVLAGKEYGTGSSRDWAAKGTLLLGVRAVIASSYERIHRSNLVGMGVLPLEFSNEDTWQSLGLTGKETFDIQLSDDLQPLSPVSVTATTPSGDTITFETTCRIDTPVELDYYRNGGILPFVLRKLAAEA